MEELVLAQLVGASRTLSQTSCTFEEPHLDETSSLSDTRAHPGSDITDVNRRLTVSGAAANAGFNASSL